MAFIPSIDTKPNAVKTLFGRVCCMGINAITPPLYKSLVINDLDTYGIQNRMARFSSAKELKRAVLRVYLNTQT